MLNYPHYNYTFIDLFAGLGGFHLALNNFGCRCVFASELEEDLQKLYSINFPDTPIRGDITAIKPEMIPAHDILCAGFPCQPFSQAGLQQGFKDTKGRGNLFDSICSILEFHKPKYIILENVSNLKSHDHGNTWTTIKNKLEKNYDIKDKILSPHQFGIAQHRKRIYIVGVRKDLGNLSKFEFPVSDKKFKIDINNIIDPNDSDIVLLPQKKQEMLSVWQEFIDHIVSSGQKIPRFPIWAMEFGATYDYKEIAPAFQPVSQLLGKKGHLGILINGRSKKDCLKMLPIYSQTRKLKLHRFPRWKIRYIEQNREFYQKNKTWLDPWIEKIKNYDNSFLKFEWNCGNAIPTLYDKIIQFRASGIRVKLPTFAPALNLVGSQTPYFPWVKVPAKFCEDHKPHIGRFMSIKEAAAIQGFKDINLDPRKEGFPLTRSRVSEALGNAVNVTIITHIANNLFRYA